jgi:hypothetical protein
MPAGWWRSTPAGSSPTGRPPPALAERRRAALRHRRTGRGLTAMLTDRMDFTSRSSRWSPCAAYRCGRRRRAWSAWSGRNGAGKTTLMRSVMGHLPPRQGRIVFDGQDLVAMPRHARAALGIGYMPEDRGLVPELTVEENILVPVWVNRTSNRRAAGPGLPRAARVALEMRSARAAALGRPAEAGGAGARAGGRHAAAAARRALRGRGAGAVEAAGRGDRRR